MTSPLTRFATWYTDAAQHPAIADASVMTLATATPDGKPAARVLLLKEHGPQGFVFYGNMESRKFRELAENPHAALCFFWQPLGRQVRVEGTVARVSEAEADAYFATRGRGKQVGAWASLQSSPMPDREALKRRVAEMEARFASIDPIPRPPHWSGYRLTPLTMEFWHEGEFRLHERARYTRADATSAWQEEWLFP